MNATRRSLLLVCALGCLLARPVLAQVSPDVQKRYQAALDLVQRKSYEQAKTELNAIMQRGGALAPYAHYYYALAAFRQRDFNQARLMLKQLMTRFPDWRKMDDAQYLLGASNMELRQYEDALTALQRIGDTKLRTDIAKLEQYFIPRIEDVGQLKQLNQNFPENRTVALALIDLIQRTSTDKNDLELSDRLTNRFGVPVTASTRPTTPTATQTQTATPPPSRTVRAKGYYNIAVLFPFRLDDFDSGRRLRNNQYAYDLYNGIKLAKAKLQSEGITVNLFAYDVDNDGNRTLELVNSPAFAQTDLIIGPLYVEPNRIAAAYANQNEIPLLNPIATGSDLIANNPMAFLAMPSLERQARQVAEYMRSLGRPVTDPANRRVAVYYGTARKDSLLAASYRDELKRNNYQVVDFQKLSGSAQAMASIMLPSSTTATRPASPTATRPVTATTAAASLPTVFLNHVFLASSNDDDGSRLLDALSRRRVSGPMMATASAFDYNRNPGSTFTRRPLFLLYPEFIDNSREPFAEFATTYLTERNTIPSIFAMQGYDMMLFFGRQLARNNGQLRNRASLRSDTDDYLLSGFDYTRSNDNQIVPIVKYDGGRFVKIN